MKNAKKVDRVVRFLSRIVEHHQPVTFASSLGAEDMVLTDLIFRHDLKIEIFTLDTGRLPEETHTLLQHIGEHYDRSIQVYFPQNEPVEAYVQEHGSNGFYASVEARKACCQIRKAEPLRRALAGKQAWITGLRREQSVTRRQLRRIERDKENGLYKFNPLLAWSHEEVWSYLKTNKVPYNRLHDQHFPSIGCEPCTRAVTVGEDIRSGRWWWEQAENRECGLHVNFSAGGVQ